MTELFESLYPIACCLGVDSVRYWDMTYGEIMAAINGRQERRKMDAQMNAAISYRQAHLIGALVSKVLGSKQKMPTITEAFPGLFPQETLEPRQQDWRIMKDRVASFGDRYKRKRGETDDRTGAAGVDPHRDSSA